jgi:hypothetical protein
MISEIILGIVWAIFLLYLTLNIYLIKKSRERVYDPFGFRQIVTCKMSCENCGAIWNKPFKRGDFIFKPVYECPTCKKGNMMITEILCLETKIKTKDELKYEKLVEKWK